MKVLLNMFEIAGIVVLAAGLIIGFMNLKGWFNDENREDFLHWVLNSNVGMPIEEAAAKEFIETFPPPNGEPINNITHLTKSKMGYQLGGIINASVNYMRKDLSRTGHVATLVEIRTWASESSYPWVSWWLTLIGFIVLLASRYTLTKLKPQY